MTLSSLHSLFVEQLRVLYAAEAHLAHGIPRLIEWTSSSDLKLSLSQQLEEAEQHLARLDLVAAQLDEELGGQRCRVVEALLREALDLTERNGDERVIHAGVVALMRMVESYQRAAYEIARDLADLLKEGESLKVLDKNLLEGNAGEQSLTVLFEDLIDSIYGDNPGAASRASSRLEEAAG